MSDIKYIEVSTGPFADLKFQGHNSAEEYDAQAGEVGACVTCADVSDAYRSLLPAFHEVFTPTLEKLSGTTRGVNADATAKAKARAKNPDSVKDVPESFITFANRAKATVGEELWTTIDAEAHKLSESMKSDSSPAARAAAGPGKAFTDKADSILSRSPEDINTTISKLLAVVTDFDLAYDEDQKPERMSLARLVKAWTDKSLAV